MILFFNCVLMIIHLVKEVIPCCYGALWQKFSIVTLTGTLILTLSFVMGKTMIWGRFMIQLCTVYFTVGVILVKPMYFLIVHQNYMPKFTYLLLFYRLILILIHQNWWTFVQWKLSSCLKYRIFLVGFCLELNCMNWVL